MAMTEEPTRSPGKDLGLLILILIILGVVWFASGGADNPPDSPYTNGSKSFKIFSGRDSRDIPKSKYYDKIIISKGNASESSPGSEYIIITSLEERKTVDITGWIFGGWMAEEDEFITVGIPKGVEKPRHGEVNEENEVWLGPGEKAIVTTGETPIGVSFKLNKCFGYLTQFQNFIPDFAILCPVPKEEKWSDDLSESCINFLNTIPRCRVPLSFPFGLETECTEEISEKLNYNYCIDKHARDKDFYIPEWRLYLGLNKELWNNTGETIMLYDSDGLIVDTLSY